MSTINGGHYPALSHRGRAVRPDGYAFGGTPDGGIARLTLSDDDRRVRDWLTAQCLDLGMTMTVDEVGNMFALRPGRRSDVLPLAMGSHLDTQPTGGRFDGVLGVLAGLEVLRTLDAAGVVTEAPLMLVNWTNEEGARFAPVMLGSGVHAGLFSRDYANSRTDAAGESFGDALHRIGYQGPVPSGHTRFGAMFELHIEQGPILEAEGFRIGVVTGVQGLRWFEFELTGVAAHSGSTPMNLRHDALRGAAQVIEGVHRIACENVGAVGTVGSLDVRPNSRNVIPGQVRASIDLRHPEDRVLDEMEREIESLVAEVAASHALGHKLERISRTSPVTFDPGCISAISAGAAAAGFATRDIVSGAVHDAVHAAAVAPTGMIFVPSQGGLSHNPAEATLPEDCAAGAQVLLDALLAYDLQC
uniref:Zn-dependent hydrolase n=1 Tax=uncultured Paracoccus sp. TaxID=189685 RepID=UPI002616658A|nr:Zn-dependent hydrolase [uncultured Paracoccus sp.]